MFGHEMFANQSFSRCFAEAGISAPVAAVVDTDTTVAVSVFVRENVEK